MDDGIGYIEAPHFPKYVWLGNGKAKQMVWDTSSLSAFSSCPRYYNFQNLLGYKSKIYSVATGFGSAVHAGFEMLDRGKFYGKTKDESIQEAIKIILLEFGEELLKSEDKARSLEATLRAIVWRAEEYWDDVIKIATMPNGEPALEQRFEVPFGLDSEERFSGRIDKVVELENELYIVDTKTTKAGLTPYYFANFMPNNQVYAYIWAARRVLKLPIAGFIVDAVQTGVNFSRFDRAVFKINDEVLDEWYLDALHKMHLANEYAKTQYYPADFTACGNYGGCKFRDICTEAPSRRSMIIDSEFDKDIHTDLKIKEDNVIEFPKEMKVEIKLKDENS